MPDRVGSLAPPPDAATAPSTGCYVYAVVPATAPGTDVVGVDGAPVELLVHGSLAAAVGRVSLVRPPGRSAELRAHAAVVDALADAGPVVPVRFGALLADEAQVVEEVLAPDADGLAASLEALRGSRQYQLRATYVADQVLAEVVAADPEVAALRQRTRDLPEGTPHPDLVRLGQLVAVAMEHKRRDDAADLMEAVRPHCRDEAPVEGGGVDHLHSTALLVADEQADALVATLESLAEAWADRIRLELVGPHAAWSFAGGDPWG